MRRSETELRAMALTRLRRTARARRRRGPDPAERKETREITLADGSTARVEVRVVPAKWAEGAGRQWSGRIGNKLGN